MSPRLSLTPIWHWLRPAERWQREVLLLAVAAFVSFTGFTFFMPFLPLFIQELGIHDPQEVAFWSGIIFGISPLLGGLLGPLWGRVADRYGYKRMVQRSLGCFFFLLLAMAFVQNVYQLFGLRFILGLVGGFSSLSIALATAAAPRERSGQAIAMIQSSQLLSGVVGPFIGGVIADNIGIRPSFYCAAAASAIAFALITFGYQERRSADGPARRRQTLPFRQLLAVPNFAALLIAIFGITFIDRSFGPLLALYVHWLGAPPDLTATIAGLVISAGGITAAISANIAGRWASPVRIQRLLQASLLGGAIICLPIALATEWWHLIILRPLLGLLAGCSLTLAFTFGSLSLPREGRAAAFGVLASASMFGTALSAPATGLLAQISLRAIWYFDALFYVILFLFLWRATRLPEIEPAAAARQTAD